LHYRIEGKGATFPKGGSALYSLKREGFSVRIRLALEKEIDVNKKNNKNRKEGRGREPMVIVN